MGDISLGWHQSVSASVIEACEFDRLPWIEARGSGSISITKPSS